MHFLVKTQNCFCIAVFVGFGLWDIEYFAFTKILYCVSFYDKPETIASLIYSGTMINLVALDVTVVFLSEKGNGRTNFFHYYCMYNQLVSCNETYGSN